MRGLIGDDRITPAHAGKSGQNCRNLHHAEDHPRSRGEKGVRLGSQVGVAGSPPLTRGKVSHMPNAQASVGITPAHAGKSLKRMLFYRQSWDHPRSRGEKKACHSKRSALRGSPPLTRGKAFLDGSTSSAHWITPAHAGKRRPPACAGTGAWDHPRSRGEKSPFSAAETAPQGSPPLTRGKVGCRVVVPRNLGITPAHAGKSPLPGLPTSPRWDHPRSRGEKSGLPFQGHRLRGSPPLTRGKASRAWSTGSWSRITPAHAGKRNRPCQSRR